MYQALWDPTVVGSDFAKQRGQAAQTEGTQEQKACGYEHACPHGQLAQLGPRLEHAGPVGGDGTRGWEGGKGQEALSLSLILPLGVSGLDSRGELLRAEREDVRSLLCAQLLGLAMM